MRCNIGPKVVRKHIGDVDVGYVVAIGGYNYVALSITKALDAENEVLVYNLNMYELEELDKDTMCEVLGHADEFEVRRI